MRKLCIAIILVGTTLFLGAQYSWTKRACLPSSGRAGDAAFAINNKGYLVGGFNQFYSTTNEVWEYDPLANTWTQKNNFPMAIDGCNVFVINDTAYVGLGIDSTGNYLTNFWKYNATSDTWTAISSFPGSPRYLGMAFALHGKGYLGCGKGGGQNNDFYQYDPSLDIWTQKANFPGSARQTGFGAATTNYGYIGMGWDGSSPLGDFYRYNDTSDAWVQMSNLVGPARFAPAYFVINDTMYVVAGKQLVTYYDDCWRYDEPTGNWVQQQDFACLAVPRSTNYGFTLNGHGYSTCGAYGNGLYPNDLLEFGPTDGNFTNRLHVLGNDTAYCGNFTQVLSSGNPCSTWSTGIIASQITVSTAGTYWVRFADSCGMVSDTITIREGPPVANLGTDTTYCGGFRRVLLTGYPNTVWSTGATAAQITVYTSGTYWAHITNACGSAADTILIAQRPAPIVNLGNDTSICTVRSFELNASNSGATYFWQDGSMLPTYAVTQSGNYSVTVTLGGCSAVDSIHINLGALPAVNISPSNSDICPGDSVQICAPSGFSSYNWNNGQITTCIFANRGGNYYVTVTDNNHCSAESNHAAVAVKPIPPVSISVNGDTLRVYDQSNIQWYLNGAPIINATNNVYVSSRHGEYNVLVIDTNGCAELSSPILLSNLAIIKSDNFSIYPNPSSEEMNVTIEPEINSISLYEVFTCSGKLVKSGATRLNHFCFRTADISNGVYILKLKRGESIFGIRRFEVMH